MNNEVLIAQAAAFKSDARREFEAAVAALIALAFRYNRMGANFLWDADPELNDKANEILRGMSDRLAQKAKARALSLSREEGWAWGGDAWEDVNERQETTLLTRFDQQGSFLRELLEVWIALAFVNGLSQSFLKISVIRYLADPYASPLWKGLPSGLLKRGPGYQRNIIDQITLIGQDAIIAAVRRTEWMDAMDNGAIFWVWRRGSNFKCPDCEANKDKAFPMDIPFDTLHPRCMCYAEYHYETLEI